MNTIQRTLVVLKPDAVQRGFIGEIITRFEKVGLKIVGMKMLRLNDEILESHYEGIGELKTRRGEKIFEITKKMMQNAPVIAMVLEGVEAVEQVRMMTGPTEPKSAVPGTIRGDFAHTSYTHADAQETGIKNLIHASANTQEAEKEVALWFSIDEMFEYKTVHDVHVIE